MRRTLLMSLCLSLLIASSPRAETFALARIAPAWGLDALTRAVARRQVERDDQPIADGIVAHAEGLPPWPALR